MDEKGNTPLFALALILIMGFVLIVLMHSYYQLPAVP